MKKVFESRLFIFIITAITFTGIGATASSLLAGNIVYDNTTSGLKDSNDDDITTVQGAIDALYERSVVGNATASQILSGKTALVGGTQVTGTMTNEGAVTLTSEQTGVITINGYVTTIDATNVYNKGKSDGTSSCSCSCSFSTGHSGDTDLYWLYKNGSLVANGWYPTSGTSW